MKRQEQLSQAQGLSDHARIVLQTFHELLKVQGLSQVNSVVLSRDPAGMLMLGSGRRWSSTSSPLGVAGVATAHPSSRILEASGRAVDGEACFMWKRCSGVGSSSSILP